MQTLLELRGVAAGYDQPVTPAFTFSLARGEVLGLAGPNGAGKSTLLNAILGSARIHAGRLVRAADLRIRHLPQRPLRPAELPVSGRELLRFMDALVPAPPTRLAAKMSLRVDRLSGGEYQLLCLWICLAGDADLVLLDEPTNHLDRSHTELAAEALGAASPHRGTLIVSHDRAFLERVCTRIIDLDTV